MSKKSRRRNKRLATAAAVLTGLALANRGKGTEMANISVGGGRDAAKMIMPKIKMPKIKMPKRGTILGKPGINRMDLSEVDMDYQAPDMSGYRNMDMGLEGFAAKDGGRARKTKGFAKKKKQANKMRKK